MATKKQWKLATGVKVSSISQSETGGWIIFAKLADFGVCPDCGKRSKVRHGWRYRTLKDLPLQGATASKTAAGSTEIVRWLALIFAPARKSLFANRRREQQRQP